MDKTFIEYVIYTFCVIIKLIKIRNVKLGQGQNE